MELEFVVPTSIDTERETIERRRRKSFGFIIVVWMSGTMKCNDL